MTTRSRSRLRAAAALVVGGLLACAPAPASAAIAQRGTATTTVVNQSATNIDLNKPSGVVAGDVMIAVISKNVQTIGTTSPPSGWTQVDARGINTTSLNNKTHGSVFYRVADGSEGSSYSFGLGGGTTTNASNGASGALLAFAGVNTTGGVAPGGGAGPFDVAPGTITVGGAISSSVTASGITTQSANAAVVMLGMVGGSEFTWSGWNTTSPGSLTEIAEAKRAGSCAAAAWAIKSSAGATGNGTATLSSAAQIPAAILVALKEAAPGPAISSFTATPSPIDLGQSSTLAWNVSNAVSVSINNGVGSVSASGSTSVTPATTTTYTLSATNGDGTTTATTTVTVVPPGPYRYYRFVPVTTRGSANVQLAEFQMTLDGNRVPCPPSGITNPSGSNSPSAGEGAQKADDNQPAPPGGDPHTKWFSSTKTNLVYDFGVATNVDGYRMCTANDSDDRDPVSWRVEGSHDNTIWKVLDTQTNYPVPTDRKIYLADFPLEPFSGPKISSFTATPGNIEPGASSTLAWAVTGAETVSISQGIGSVAASGSQAVTQFMTTTYTLTAVGDGVTKTKTINVIVNGRGPYRYYRFVPTALRNPGEGIVSIGEFQMLLGGARVTGAIASETGGSSSGGEGPPQGNDDSLSTKWLNFGNTNARLILDFGKTTPIDGYRIGMSDDNGGRAPVSWRLEGSHDNTAWTTLDTKTNYATPEAQVYLPDFSLAPFAGPIFNSFAASPASMLPGQTSTLSWSVSNATSVSIDNGIGSVSSSGSTSVSPIVTTTYTLTAIGEGFTRTATTVLEVPNTPPTFAGFAASTPYETAATISFAKLLLAASDAENDAVSVTAAGPTSAQGGTAVLQAGSILYTPADGFSGSDSFSITLTDARGATASGTVSVTVASNSGVGTSSPVLTALPGGDMKVDFQGIPGRTYEVQRSTDLTNWDVLATVVAGPTGAVTHTDENPPEGSAFYRLRKP